MGELSYLASELQNLDSTESVEEKGEVVGFNVDRGAYNSLSSEVLTVLGRYDAELYVFPEEEYNFRAVAP